MTAVTPVALDHQAYLGDTIERIAFEKAGIIKPGVPVLVGEQDERALAVIEEVARAKQSPVLVARQDFDWYRDATGFVYQDENGLLNLPLPRLVGRSPIGKRGHLPLRCCEQPVSISPISHIKLGWNRCPGPGGSNDCLKVKSASK